jgi:predicted Na+-dependent transporter
VSHGYTTTKWVRENLPELVARGPEVASKAIEQAILDARTKRFWAVLLTILVPAVVVNLLHTEIADMLGGAISRIGLLSISIVVSAIVATQWSRKILQGQIETLAQEKF